MRTKDAFHKVTTGMHRAVFSGSRGRVLGRAMGMLVVELVTAGRKTGKPRSTMLTAPIIEGDRLVLVASFGGDDRHPAWYLNLRDDPEVEVTYQGRTRRLVARTASAEERDELWPRITAAYHGYAEYQRRTARQIPVVVLEPAGAVR